jgi:ABC-type Fe3+-siderophore transport system permease subunit
MGRIVSALITACAWLSLLGLVAAGVARASIEAKERRTLACSGVTGFALNAWRRK